MSSRSGPDAPAPPSLLGGYGRGVGWTYLSLLLTGGSTFFLAAWAVRRIGTAQYGLFAMVTSVTALLAIFDYALGFTVQRAGARVAAGDEAEHAETVRAAHGAYVLLGLGGAVLTLVAAAAAGVVGNGSRPYLIQTVGLLGVSASLQLATAALPAVALAVRRFSLRSGAALVGVSVKVAVAVATIGRYGVAGLALAQLAGVIVERVALVPLVRRRIAWFALRPSLPSRLALRGVSGDALPLLLISASGQLFAVSDMVIIGVLVGASAVGVYQVSSLAPLYIAAVLVIGYNVAFPSLAGSDDAGGQEDATMFLTRLFSYLGAVALGITALLRADVVDILLGRRDGLAEDVLLLLCGMSMAGLLVHGLASLLIARGRSGLMARAVIVQIPVNIVLTVGLVATMGAVGAPIGTLLTAVLMDVAILPRTSTGQFQCPALNVTVRHGVVPAVAGVVVAAVAAQVAGLAELPMLRVVVGGVAAAILGAGVGLVLLGPGGRRSVRDALAAGVVL
ncbi:MAG: oligosaccharide flippase family protein [Actinomycetota bacterium]|nr:oligosaccharide flippase family protein [Actinomycetota bacterium]